MNIQIGFNPLDPTEMDAAQRIIKTARRITSTENAVQIKNGATESEATAATPFTKKSPVREPDGDIAFRRNGKPFVVEPARFLRAKGATDGLVGRPSILTTEGQALVYKLATEYNLDNSEISKAFDKKAPMYSVRKLLKKRGVQRS